MLTFVSGVGSQQVKDWNQIYIVLQNALIITWWSSVHHNVDPRKAAASSYTSLAVQHCHQPRPGYQWSAFTHLLWWGDQRWYFWKKKKTEKCQHVFCIYGVHVAEKVKAINKYHHEGPGSDGSSPHRALITEESVAMTPKDVSLHPRACG